MVYHDDSHVQCIPQLYLGSPWHFQVTEGYLKLPKVAQNRPKSPKVAQNRLKSPKIARNFGQNKLKSPKVALSRPKLRRLWVPEKASEKQSIHSNSITFLQSQYIKESTWRKRRHVQESTEFVSSNKEVYFFTYCLHFWQDVLS